MNLISSGLATSDEPDDGAVSKADWERSIENSGDRTELERLELVNRFFNHLRFVDDLDHWGRADYWATPGELLDTGGGDCEDLSIAKYFTLEKMGVPMERMRITYAKALPLRRPHMVLAYYSTPDADPLILDNLVNEIRPASRRRDLHLIYSFNGDGVWVTRERGQGRRVNGISYVSPWRNLKERMAREGTFFNDSKLPPDAGSLQSRVTGIGGWRALTIRMYYDGNFSIDDTSGAYSSH